MSLSTSYRRGLIAAGSFAFLIAAAGPLSAQPGFSPMDKSNPAASKQEYGERLVGPLGAALTPPRGRAPDLFAIPGNHDWYDGLVSFSRLFTQGRTLGAWQTRQRRSYFAIQLPQHWWLWAVDVQLESDIDVGQLN